MAKNNSSIPEHVAIIMDGNRRWAKKRGLPIMAGHKRGFENFKKIAEECFNMGVKILTVFAFSTENWKRSGIEVRFLIKFFERVLKEEKDFFQNNNIRLNAIGQIEWFPKKLKGMIQDAVEETKNNKKGILNLAVSYGGREELLEAAKKIIKKKIPPEKLTEEIFGSFLHTAGQRDPELLIRTGGEMRLSGFLPWQSVYSELYFTNKLWPDFSADELKKAIKEFQNRQRRFGK